MAVIYRTEGAMKSIRVGKVLQGIVLVLVLSGAVGAEPQDCQQAGKDAGAAGLPADALLERPMSGEVCGANSCCSSAAEQLVLVETKRRIETFLKDSISKLASLVDLRARKFDALFREMMNNSRIEFHEMFQKTYGKIYLQNSDVFSDFFGELETYYKKGGIRLTDMLENFFGILYQRMFKVINSQYQFDQKYLDCVSVHMMDVKPFGDVPHKFTLQLRRSFVATRTYYKALATAAQAAKAITAVKIDKECEREMVNMQFCGSCKGLRGTGTCSNYCAAVLETCLRHHTAFSAEWDNFIDALDKVADRLVGPYNIEMVVEPLNIKISEAIMNFQDSGIEVSKKIYNICGKPMLNRRKRKVNKGEIKYSTRMNEHSKRKKNKKYEEDDSGPTLEKLIKEIKTKVRETRQFWAHLPYQYCNNITAPVNSEGRCWNGTAIGDYSKPTVKPPSAISPVVKEQTYVLQLFTDKLRKAYHGDEVEIIDDEDEETGDGSGSGSGDFEIVDDPEEEDNLRKTVPDPAGDFETFNEIPAEAQPPPSTKKPEVPRTYSGGASTISLSRALVQYLLPIVLVWFGGAISDLL